MFGVIFKELEYDLIYPATGELDIGRWYVTYPTYLPAHPTHPELSQAGSLKQTLIVS